MAATSGKDTAGVKPVRRRRVGYSGLSAEDTAAGWTNFIADTSNFHMLHYRHVDGFLVSAKNSGTHWLHYMLSHALAAQYGVEPPRHSTGPHADHLIGPAKQKPRYPQMPHLALSHTIPSRVFSWRWAQGLFGFPPAVVLIRDIRKSLESVYVKWLLDEPEASRPDFATYVAGDPWQRHPPASTWWYVQFLNHWGDVATALPERTFILRYEDMAEAPGDAVAAVARHFGIELTPEAIAAAIAVSTREAMRESADPRDRRQIVSEEETRAQIRFTGREEEILRRILRRHLRYDFGYDWF